MKFGSNYAWFNNQFTTLTYCVLAQIITSYKYFFTNDITDEMKAFPVWKFFLFGVFDGLAGFLFSIGAPNTPATLQNIINQTIIPMTMVASFIVLRARYGLGKIGGAGIILAGAFVALIPLFTNNKNSDNPPALWYAILIYVSNNVPQALSNVTKELAFGQVVLDVYYMGSWVAWFQLGVSLSLLPVTMLPGFGGISASEIPDQIQNGYYCLLGWNTMPGDACEYNYIFTGMYVAVNFGYNIFILLVTKHASATLFTLAFALRLPLTQVVYTLHFIMFSLTEDFTWETIVSLVVVLVGFAIYSAASSPAEPEAGADEENKDLLGADRDEPEPTKERTVALFNPRLAGVPEQVFAVKPEAKDQLFLRKSYMYRLGIKTPEVAAYESGQRTNIN
jgi:drug/metabolite transporter (DMT)-like permease